MDGSCWLPLFFSFSLFHVPHEKTVGKFATILKEHSQKLPSTNSVLCFVQSLESFLCSFCASITRLTSNKPRNPQATSFEPEGTQLNPSNNAFPPVASQQPTGATGEGSVWEQQKVECGEEGDMKKTLYVSQRAQSVPLSYEAVVRVFGDRGDVHRQSAVQAIITTVFSTAGRI